MTKTQNNAKTPMCNVSKLYSIFNDQPNLAWEMLEQQCDLYTSAYIDVEEINKLTSFYCKIVVKLNELQDPRQKYFSNKMQKLMAEPFIIRCYTDDCSQKKNTNVDLKQKRKELEQKISFQTQKQNSLAFQRIIQSQTQKQKRLKSKISEVIGQHQKNLQNRLQMRLMKKHNISPTKKNSQDSIIHKSSQLGNPEFMTPNKSQRFEQLQFLDLKLNKIKSQSLYASRPQSERVFNYRQQETNEDSSSDSEDQYRIQKMLRQEKIHMAKKRQDDLFNQDPKRHKK